LPPEIQEYITKISVSMHLNDIRMDTRKKALNEEIIDYSNLKNAWGLGSRRNANGV